MKKGHKDYLLVIYDLDKGLALDVLKDRKKETLKEYLQKLPKKTKDNILSICIDMWKPYRICLEKVFPTKIIIVDRFHVSKELNKAVDNVRKELQEQGKLDQLTGDERKKLYWAIRFSGKKLREKPEYKVVLKKAMRVCPEIKKVVHLRRKFNKIFSLKEAHTACKHLSNWLRTVTRSKLTPLIKFSKTFKNWRPWIMNFFTYRRSNGPAEGLNNKIKLIKRLGYGFRSITHFRLRICTLAEILQPNQVEW